MMRLTLWLALAGTLGASGCKEKPAATRSAPGSAAMGSGSASSVGSAGSAGSAAPATMATADIQADFLGCWDALDDAKWEAYKRCFADTATYEMVGAAITANGADAIIARAKALKAEFPGLKGQVQLALVNGHHLAAFTLVTGTNTKNKKFGFYAGQLLEVNDQGQVTSEHDYADLATPEGQLHPDPHHPVRPVEDKLALPASGAEAKDDAKEQANVEVVKKLVAAFDRHDAKAYAALLDDHFVSTENAAARDTNKAVTMKGNALLWKSFSNVKLDITQQWGAGDFVVTAGAMDGTNDGPVAGMGIKKGTNKMISVPYLEFDEVENGKVMHAWLFDSSAQAAQQLGTSRATTK